MTRGDRGFGSVGGWRLEARWVGAVTLTLLAFGHLGAAPVAASEDDDERPSPSRVIFGSLDAGPAKRLLSQGAKQVLGPGSLGASGFRTLANSAASTETAAGAPPGRILRKLELQALVGFEWRLRQGSLALYTGPDLQVEAASGAGRIRYRIGQRIHADLWYSPLPRLTVQLSAYAATLDRRLWLRLAPGFALPWQGRFGRPELGPELELYRQDGYSKLRIGLQLRGLRLLRLNWQMAAGWERSSAGAAQAYATIGMHWRK